MKRLILALLIVIVAFLATFQKVYAYEGSIEGPEVIFKDKNRILTMSEIRGMYSSLNGPITVTEDGDGYTGHGDIPGIYTIELTDGVELREIKISVRNTIGPITAVSMVNDQYTIHVYKSTILTNQDIVTIMERINVIQRTSSTVINILSNTYAENANAPGIYSFEFRIATASGIEQIHTVKIMVSNSNELTPDIELPKTETGNTKFIKTLSNILEITGYAVVIIIILFIGSKVFKLAHRKKRRGNYE